MKYVVVIGLTLLAHALACSPLVPNGPGPPAVEPKAGEPGCPEFCAHLAGLIGVDGAPGCESGRPTPGGSTCLDFCSSTLENGQDLHIACALAVDDCADIDRASQGCS